MQKKQLKKSIRKERIACSKVLRQDVTSGVTECAGAGRGGECSRKHRYPGFSGQDRGSSTSSLPAAASSPIPLEAPLNDLRQRTNSVI